MAQPLRAFSAYGIEIEYAIVRTRDLGVEPIADYLLEEAEGELVNETEQGALAWSNELALHVIELKTNGVSSDLAATAAAFQHDVDRIGRMLGPRAAMLMPGAVHPWMNPDRDTRLWPHGDDEIYRAYDRIFGCKGHGWSNLQSMHVNLPFAGEDEFVRLHAAVRAVLPILPALAASSPFLDGADTGFADARLETYKGNQARIPSIAGSVVPEPVDAIADYEAKILAPMYRDIAPHDPDDILKFEWLNSRGAIARFDRNAIEIRLLDTQERPAADLAIAALVARVAEMLFRDPRNVARANAIETSALAALLDRCIADGERVAIVERDYLELFGVKEARVTAGALWLRLAGAVRVEAHRAPLAVILEEGTLATRLRKAVGRVDQSRLESTYRSLCACLAENRAFDA